MALFPAYENKDSKGDANESNLPWLQNDSCPDIATVHELVLKDQPDRSENERKSDKEHHTSDSDEDKEEKANSLYEKHKKLKKKKKKSDKKLKEHSRKRRKKSSHGQKKKKSRYSTDTDSEDYDQRCSQEHFPVIDGRQKGVLFDGEFRMLKKEEIIYLDRLPDKNNSIFSSTHYTQLSRYRKLRSIPMGMTRIVKRKKKNIRFFSKPFRAQLDTTPVIKLIKHDLRNQEYIPLNLTYNEEQRMNEQLNRYQRNNVGDQKVQLLQEGHSERDYWQNLNKSFNENLSKDPHNISLWMEFLDIQDKVMAHCFNNSDQKMIAFEKNQKSVIERKISVLESAIGKNRNALELYLKRLHLGESVWEKEKLDVEWNKLVYSFINNISVWHNYLIFHQTYFALFHLDHVVKAYSKCSERLIQMQQKTFLSHKPPENLVFELIDITAELACIWYQGGFMERSIALFQALIELNFFCPQELDREHMDFNSKIEIFEAFWDSKAPRFGENKSIGWAKFMEKGEPVIFPEKILEGTQDEEDEILVKGGTKIHLWLEIEFSRERNHWLPWQEDPEYCEDLERMISFSVVKRHLFVLDTDEERFYLILRFLNFLGVSIPNHITEGSFPIREYDSVFFPSRLETLESVVNLDKESSNPLGLFSFPVIGPSVHKFESETYFEFICGIIQRFILLLSLSSKIKLALLQIGLYTRRILALKRKCKDEFNVKSVVKNYKKNIKNLLKEPQFRSDSGIYLEYAKFESSIGNNDEACKIHSMILKLTLENNGNIFSDDANSENLWCHFVSYVRLHLERDTLDEKIVNGVLSAIYGVVIEGKFALVDSIPGATEIRRLRNKLDSFIDTKLDCLLKGELERSNVLSYSISLLSMMLLMIEGYEEVCLLFEKYLSKLCSCSSSTEQLKRVKELLYGDYLWTINVVTENDHFRYNYSLPQSLVKQILKSAVKESPNNLYFLENFAKKQNWRDTLCGSGIQPKNDGAGILFTIFRILPQIRKVVAVISTAEFGNISSGYQLQSVLESAVSSESGKNCPLLWRIYLRLISVMKPKELLPLAYRALHSCPFAKCLYLDCINLIPEKMTEIMKMMIEKGIRIRLPVEELEVLLEEEKEDEDEEETKDIEETNTSITNCSEDS